LKAAQDIYGIGKSSAEQQRQPQTKNNMLVALHKWFMNKYRIKTLYTITIRLLSTLISA
jgi:hypothetical protein